MLAESIETKNPHTQPSLKTIETVRATTGITRTQENAAIPRITATQRTNPPDPTSKTPVLTEMIAKKTATTITETLGTVTTPDQETPETTNTTTELVRQETNTPEMNVITKITVIPRTKETAIENTAETTPTETTRPETTRTTEIAKGNEKKSAKGKERRKESAKGNVRRKRNESVNENARRKRSAKGNVRKSAKEKKRRRESASVSANVSSATAREKEKEKRKETALMTVKRSSPALIPSSSGVRKTPKSESTSTSEILTNTTQRTHSESSWSAQSDHTAV
jgi:hypothetical protein